jgi:hypothetical protein
MVLLQFVLGHDSTDVAEWEDEAYAAYNTTFYGRTAIPTPTRVRHNNSISIKSNICKMQLPLYGDHDCSSFLTMLVHFLYILPSMLLNYFMAWLHVHVLLK